MAVDDLLLLVTGSVLTVLALVSWFFIVVEVVLFVRGLGRRRAQSPRPGKVAVRRVDGSGSLVRPRKDEADPAASPIQPMRDAEVVRQLIEHFKEGDAPPTDG